MKPWDWDKSGFYRGDLNRIIRDLRSAFEDCDLERVERKADDLKTWSKAAQKERKEAAE